MLWFNSRRNLAFINAKITIKIIYTVYEIKVNTLMKLMVVPKRNFLNYVNDADSNSWIFIGGFMLKRTEVPLAKISQF